MPLIMLEVNIFSLEEVRNDHPSLSMKPKRFFKFLKTLFIV